MSLRFLAATHSLHGLINLQSGLMQLHRLFAATASPRVNPAIGDEQIQGKSCFMLYV